MAVAGDRASRFGTGETEVRINKPLTLKPTFPRFLAVGDKALFGAVVTSQLPDAGDATVTIRSLDPTVLEFNGAAEQTVTIPRRRVDRSALRRGGEGGRPRARADDGAARQRDRRVRGRRSRSRSWSRRKPSRPTARSAATRRKRAETLTIPTGVVPGFGGLHVELASTAMVGLGEGARYLVEYPYGCAEQRGSRALALLLAADLGDAFTLPGIDTGEDAPGGAADAQGARALPVRRTAASPTGRATALFTSPYLTSYLLHVFKVASDLKYDVDRGDARARLQLSRDSSWRSAPPDKRGLVAGLHRVAGVRGQGAGRRRPQPGLQHHPPLRLSRSDAGLRARVSARRAARERRDQRRPRRRSAPADDERDSPRGRQRARRGAERSVSALVLELQRALDGDRAELARPRGGAGRRRFGRSSAG